jgi:hypothetical protein
MPLANNSEGLTNTPPAGQPSSMLSPTPMLSTPIARRHRRFNPRDRAASVLAAATDRSGRRRGQALQRDRRAGQLRRPGAGR